MKYSSQERRVLGAAELRGRATTRELASLADLPEHTVNYTPKRLEERGVFGGIKPSINTYPFGRCHYGFFLKLGRAQPRLKERFVKLCRESDSIPWCAEVGGSYSYMLSVAAADPVAAHAAFDQLRRSIAVEFKVDLAIRLRVESYGRKYLFPEIDRGTPLWYGGPLGAEQIDREDLAILRALQKGSHGTAAEVSRATGIPLSSVVRRMRSLESRNIITGYYREMAPITFGIQTFNIHLRNVSHYGGDAVKSLFAFARRHENIIHAIHTLGAWDFELAVEAHEIKAVARMLDELSNALKTPIDAEIVPVFEYVKYKPI